MICYFSHNCRKIPYREATNDDEYWLTRFYHQQVSIFPTTSWSLVNKYQQYFVPYFQILKGGRLGGRWPPRGGWLLIMILDGFFIGDKSIWRRGEWTTATAAKFNPPKGYNEPIGQTLCQSPLRSYLLPLFLLVSMLDGCKVMYWNPFQQQTICNPLSFLYDYTQPGYFLRFHYYWFRVTFLLSNEQ